MIEIIWARIIENAGEIFYLKTGKPFTYEVEESSLRPDTHKTLIHKSQFEKALEMDLVPANNTKPFQEAKLWGPSYLYAILMDQRIKKTDW